MNSYIGQAPVFGDFPFQILSGDGTASYTMSFKVSNENGMLVFLNGAIQRPGIDFTAGGNALVFSGAVAIGVQIFAYGMGLPKSTLATSAGSIGDVELSASLKLNRISEKYSKLRISATGLSSLVTITADHIALLDSSFNQKVVQTVNIPALNLASAGVNGLDTGTSVASTWYSVWVIWNGTTSITAGLLSTSETNPLMPVGYTHKARVGWIRSDATGNKFPLSFGQLGAKANYRPAAGSNLTARPVAASGVAGSISVPTYIAVPLGSYVPPSAVTVSGTITNVVGTNASVIVAPNAAYGASASATNPPYASAHAGSAGSSSTPFDMQLETTSMYWASNTAGQTLVITGWEDTI